MAMHERFAAGLTAAHKATVAAKAKGKRPRDRKATIAPTPWDMGANGPANQRGLVQEDADWTDPETGKKVNPNGVKRMRRKSWIATYFAQDKLEAREYLVADSIQRAAHGRLSEDPLVALLSVRAPAGADPQAAAVDRRRDFHRMMKLVPDYAKPVVNRVVIEDMPVWGKCAATRNRHITRLSEGLKAVADAMDRTRA